MHRESNPAQAVATVLPLLDWVARIVVLGFALYAAGHLYYALAHRDLYIVGWHRTVRYCVAPALLLCFFVMVGWRASRFFRGQVAIYGSCLLVGCFAYELIPDVVMKLRREPTSIAEACDRRMRGADAYPTFSTRSLMSMLHVTEGQAPLLVNVPNAETILCRKGERWIDYRSDAWGFNNPMPFPESLALAVVGDSFVHGICLDRPNSLVGQIRAREPRTLGFGILAHGPLLELGVLLQYVRPLAPETVVWIYYEGNDLADLELERQEPSILQLLESDGFPTSAMQARVEQARDYLKANLPSLIRPPSINWRDRFALLQLSQTLGLDYGRAGGPLDLLERVLARAKNETHAWGGRLVLVFLPEYQRYNGLLPHRGAMEIRNRQIERLAERLELPLIDLTRAFDSQDHPKKLFDPADAHLSEAGATLAAETILRGLEVTAPPAVRVSRHPSSSASGSRRPTIVR